MKRRDFLIGVAASAVAAPAVATSHTFEAVNIGSASAKRIAMVAAAPKVWVRLDGCDWFEVPMWNNTVEQTVANFSVGWGLEKDGKMSVHKVETCVTYGDETP